MTSKNKNIDNAFKDAFQGKEANPPGYIWKDIQSSLALNKGFKYNKLVWLAAASVAVVIAFSAGYFLSKTQFNNNLAIKKTNEKQNNINISELNKNESIQEAQIISNELKTKTFKENNKNNTTQKIAQNTKTEQKQNLNDKSILVKTSTDNQKPKTQISKTKNAVKLIRKKLQKIEVHQLADIYQIMDVKLKKQMAIGLLSLPPIAMNSSIEKDEKDKWLIGGNITPLYSYRNINHGSGLWEETNDALVSKNINTSSNNNELPLIAYSGGVELNYNLNNRLSMQTGIGYFQTGQISEEVFVFERRGSSYNNYSVINSSAGAVIADHKSKTTLNELAYKNSQIVGMDAEGSLLFQNNSELVQSFEYLEVPLVFKYTIIDKKIKLNILGGFSTSLLVSNDALLVNSYYKQKIGETDNIRSINYNGITGIGINYEITNNMILSVEPKFRYSLNQIDKGNTTSNHPYSLGVYTGCYYSF
ncbi:MAG: outer membrane beta-barrel protein [Bacteroidota bacterium]|nr:outer membrane beta-barrel protein [Bacteroidota bacterium]